MNFAELSGLTMNAFENPRPGDRFHEMYSFWMWVVSVAPELIVVEEAWGNDESRERRFESAEAFRAAYAYGSIPGYWVMFHDNKGREL